MRLLLTGAGGLLGGAIAQQAHARGHACVALAREAIWAASPTALAAALQGHELLIHAAANTNVEQCELEPEACYRDNWLLSERLARAAALASVPMVFVSSTGVYGLGRSQPWREFDPVAPTTDHHRAKHLAEQAVLACAPRNLVLRTGWLFGGVAANPKNFVARRLDEARAALAAGAVLRSNAEQRGVPCSAEDVAERLLALAEAGHAGVLNCVNEGAASRFDYVQAIVEAAGLAVSVQPAEAASFKRRAQVSPNEMAENWAMACLGLAAMPSWRLSLATYVQRLLEGNP